MDDEKKTGYRRSVSNFAQIEMAESLAELDPIRDTVEVLRGEVLECLKTEDFLPVSATGPENLILIDAVIRILLVLI